MKRVVIVHGWGGSSQSDFLLWAKEELEKKGYDVVTPNMPDTEYPKIETWVPHLAQTVGEVKKDDIFIGHSMGSQAVLRFLESLPEDKKVRRVIVIAGFGSYIKGLTKEEQRVIQPWLDAPLNLDKIRTKASSFTAIFSDNDPYVPLEANEKIFKEKLGAKIIVEHNKGHFNFMPDERPDLLSLFEKESTDQKNIKIVQDIDQAISVMRKVGKWLLETDKNPSKWWRPENLNSKFLLQYAKPEEFYVALIADKPAAAAVLQFNQNAQDWQSIDKDEAQKVLYIHWLCVDRQFAGMKLPKIIIDFASNKAKEENVKLLRVDTNANEVKLRKLYEDLGFYLVAVEQEDYRKTAFYQKKIN